MKRITALLSLLVTAILCLGLASCDLKLINKENETAVSTTSEETTTVPVESTTVDEFLTEPDTAQLTTEAKTTPTTGNDGTTKPVTTVPAATTKPQTTVPTTTVPTTVAPTTTVEQTTAPTRPTTIVTDSEDNDLGASVIRMVNEKRTAEGLAELSYSAELTAAAEIRAKEISQVYGQMRPDGNFWFTVSPLAMAENIGKGYATPAEMMNFWMESEGHRKNILTKGYTKIGIGCYYDNATETYYWVQLFG